MIAREPVLNPIAIAELRPTQITVGFREVAEKRREWRERAEKSAKSGVDDATAGRVRNIVDALHSDSPDHLDSALLTTNQHVVAIQLIAPDGKVVKRAGSAPATPLIPINEFDFNLRRGMPDDAVRDDDLRVSGQKVNCRVRSVHGACRRR